MGLNPYSQEYKNAEAAYKENKDAGQSTNEAYKNALSQTNNGKNAVQPASQPPASSGPLSAYTDKKWINTGGGRRHVDNFEVRNGKIFDVASENAAIRNTQANYEQFLNGKLKEYGSDRSGRYGQYTNNFMDINRYAEHEMFMSTVNVNNLEKKLEELQKEYEKVRISGTGGSAETDLKKQIAEVEKQIKEYQLDAKAAEEYMNLVKESQAAEEAWNKAQEAGLNSMDWYDQTMAEYDDIKQQLDDLYDQRRDAVRAAEAEDYSGWATDDLSAASIGGKNKADVSNIEGQIIRLTYQQDELKKQLGYANRYRWESVDTTDEQAIAMGKATYEQQHQQWNEQLDERLSQLSSAGGYATLGMGYEALSISKEYKEPTEDWTEQQKNTYYALLGDGSDTRRADEFAMNTNNLIQQQKNQTQATAVGDAATNSFYSGAWRTAVATGAGLASGLEYLGDLTELSARGVIMEKPFGLADYNQAVTGSISTYLNNQYGTLGESAGVLAGKGLGDAYQIAQSVGQSWAAMALTGGSSAAVNVMFFGQAAKQTLDEQLAKGADPYKAVLMGALSGSAEVIGETLSLENIKGLQAGQTKGLLLDILRSAGIEGSEEGMTTLLNTFADRIVNGNESDYYVALEGYISQGMSYAEAERAAMKDWVNGIAYDMIAGAASGGISGGVGGPVTRAVTKFASGFQEFEGDTKTLVDTAAGFKDTKAADLATKYGGKESITNRQAGKLGNAIDKATVQQNERNIHNAISAELKARGVTSNTGDISNAIQKSASGKMLTKEEHYLVRDTPGARAIRDELFDRMTNGKLDAEKLAAEDTPQWMKSIEQKNGAAVAGEAMFGKILREAAEQRLTEADRIETINPEVTIGDVSGNVSGVTSTGKTAQITITGPDGTQSSVNLEDALDSGAIPSDVAYLARSAAAFGTDANDVYNLYSPTQTAREYIAAMDAAINTVAANVGSRSAFEQSDSVKYLTKEQRDFAWSEGQKQRTQTHEKSAASKDTGKKKTRPKEGTVSFGGVTYEGRTFKATTADKVKPEVLRVLEKFAAATGVNIVFYESEADQRGDYVGANGFYRNGTIYLDVHAGAKSTSEKEAVLITAAHEFTHFIRENAPRRYNQLKEFVTEHLLENGYDFETLVERKIKAAQKDGGLSRDAAVEEVVADACEMVLGNSKAIERLAKEKPGLAKRIADWLHEFFADIRKAFEGVEARHEEAKAMLDYMDELTKLWDDALVEAAENRGETKKAEENNAYFSLREFEDGRRFVDVTIDQKQFDGLSISEINNKAKQIIKRKFGGKVVGIDNKAFVNGNSAEKYAYFTPGTDKSIIEAKARASTELDNLIDAGTNFRKAEDGADGHIHPDVVDGFTYFDTVFKVGNQYYSGIINIKNNGKGKLFWGVTKVKNITQDLYASYGENPTSMFLRDVSMDSIRNSDPNVKKSRRDSAEGLTKEEARAQAASYTRLKAENAELRRRVEYWKGQTQRTKQATVRQADVNRFARQLIKRYGSTADQAYIRKALQEMGDYLVQNNGEALDYDQLRQMAVTVAAELVATAEATEENSYAEDVAGEILSTIRNTDIRMDSQYFNDLPEGFRRDFRGKLHIFTDKGRSVDSIYAELQEEYGYDLFPVIDNPADQLVMMGDIFDRLSAGPEIYNPFRGAENEATLSIANEIMDTMLGEDIRQTAPTMKDKADAKVAEVKAEGKQKLDQLRSDKNARIQEIRRQESLRRQEVRAKEKAAKWDKVAEVKAYYQNMQKNAAEKRRENAASKKYRDRVFDKVNTLETWLRKNTDNEHIPEALKEPLIAFLSSIDLTSKQQLKGKGPTQRDIKYTEALQKIKDIVDNQAKYLNDPDNANGLDVYLDIPNGFDQSIKDHIESVNSILSGTDLDMSGPVVLMSSDQLKDLDFILTVLTNSIKKINQYITESHFASVMEGARESNAYMKELGKSRDKTVIGDNAEKFTLWSNTLPYYAFKRFGAAGVERFRALMNGWGKMAMNVQTVMQFTDKTYSADEAKRWEENVRTIDLSDGSQVRMTDAQIMGLWCLARREQGLGHILVGGIRVGDIKPKGVNKKRIRQNDSIHLTQDDLISIFWLLSDRQIEVAKKLQEFLNRTCSEWGNEVSMARFGYRQFTERFYYPINVDRNNLPMSDPQARETDIFRLLNMSATKALTPNANNSVVINSIFDVFAAHTADMAKYNGLALPILDLLKWYNYKDKTYHDVTDSLGNITTQMTAESVQSVMERTYGKMAQKYVMNFMKDLNGVREGGRNEELLKGMVGRYKAAAVGANLRVAIQQPTSIARAAYVIDPRYLARGMAMKGGINEAMNHSGLAVWKSLGYFDTNIARNMRDQIKHTETAFDKFTDKSMELAEKGDKITWGAIWNAAKLEMKETRHLSGDALMKATQERFDEIILATQVMDSTISRSDMMRNQSLAVSEVTSFRSEPTVTYNMLLDSYMDFNMELRKTKSASTAFRRTGGKMLRSVTVYAATAALTAAAAAIVDAFRDDDDYQTAVEKWLEHFKDNISEAKEPWRLLPIVDQLYDIFLNNETPDSMLWQSFTQLRKSGASAVELMKMLFGDNPEATSRYTAWGKAYTIMQGLSSITGLPVSAAYRDIKAVWNASGALLWPDLKMKFYESGVKNQVKYGVQDGYLTEEEAISILVESGEVSDPDDAYWLTQEWLHADDSEWTRYNELHAAILAGDKKAFAAAQEALGDHGITPYSVRTEAKNQIGRLYRGDDGKGSKLTEKQAVSYLMEFAGLGELEAKHLKDEWDLQRLYGLKVSEIGDAYVSGQITAEKARDYYIRFGHYYPKDAAKKLLELDCEKETGIKYSMLNDAYIHDEITEQEAQAYLMGYGGLTQAEAEAKTLQWDLARDYGIQYGSSDEGIKKALTEEFIDQETAITIMETYGGKTHEEAEDYSYQYLFTNETGYNFSEIQKAFEDGVIDEDEMAYWYRVGSIYTHGSEEKAWEYVEVAKWKSEVPGGESMNRTGLDKWYQKSGKLQAQGLGKEDFAKVWTIYSKADAEYDANGNQTKEKAQVVMEQIGQLSGYTKTQLTALGYAVYSAKKVNAYKTW